MLISTWVGYEIMSKYKSLIICIDNQVSGVNFYNFIERSAKNDDGQRKIRSGERYTTYYDKNCKLKT